MICPKCQGKSKVYNSRPLGDTTRRHRQCLTCGHKYSTIETLETKVVKLDDIMGDPMKKLNKITVKRKPVKKKKRFEDMDFENMCDEELEALIHGDDFS